VLSEFFLAKARHYDGQFVRWQGIGIVENGRDRQVLATHWPVDDDLQALDRREDVDGTPVAASPVMI
jgi:hypothetical protein